MNIIESKFDSDIFGVKVGKLDVFSGDAESFSAKTIFDVVFVKIGSWVYPKARVSALDHRYEMGKEDRPPSGCEVTTTDRLDRLEGLAGEAFVDSRFFRDEKLAAKAPQLYVNWLKAGTCWVLPKLEGDAFLLQTWDDPYTARISLIAVRREARGLGLGRKLLGGVLGQVQAKSWRVCVSACNLKALRLYQSFGFRVLSASTAYHVWARGRGKTCQDT